MPTYSHSRISTYESCPLQYKLSYIDRIKRDTEGIEAFLGNRVHEVLEKCYEDARRTKICTLDELLACYDNLWQKNWHDGIVITRKDLEPVHYRDLGRKMIETFYKRYAPFSSDSTVGTELRLTFSLDDAGNYRFSGIVDRLAQTADGTFCIHDYKTGAYLPPQSQADNDRQLALCQIGVQKHWPDVKSVKLIWHYLAHDRELVSTRTPEVLYTVAMDTMRLIDEIDTATDFPPKESPLCDWCEYPDLCPNRKHMVMLEKLPPNKYLSEPGVVLVNRFAQLRQQASAIDTEMEQVREALVEYARRNNVTVIRGSDRKARVRFDTKLKFPGKNDPERVGLDLTLIEVGKWGEVSQLDTTALIKAIEEKSWNKELIDRVLQFGKLEETSSVYLSRLKEDEK